VHAVDVVAVCCAVLILLLLAAVLARQRFMLRASGAVPLAVQVHGNRWVYGIGRYAGGELRFYRAIGLGTRPTRVLQRRQLRVIGHRAPRPSELSSLPATAVIVECTAGSGGATLALGEGAYTGFVSWLESSAPRS
jgi:hypothetical protein